MKSVFLAVTTSDMKEQRDTLRRDLLERGFTVVPEQMVPVVADEARKAIGDALARCEMSIHLVGKNYGFVPEGAVESLIEMQHELATERAASGGFSRLIWIPTGVQPADERQQRLLERLRADPRIKDGADLLETFFEDFRGTLHEWLLRDRKAPGEQPAAGASGGETPRVYLIADPRDGELISPWADALFDQKLEVIRPIFDGDETEIREFHEENLASCDGVLIFFGAGNELWLRRKLRELQKAAGYGRTKPRPAVGICLVGARTPEKERFRTYEAQVMPQWEGVDLASLGPFLARLKAGGA
jgi:hypothetical protein